MNKVTFFIGLALVALMNSNSAYSSGNDKVEEEKKKEENVISFDHFAMGADLSYVNQVEDYGGVYKADGVQKDPFSLFKAHGANLIRLRLWHNPEWTKDVYDEETILYSGFDDVVKSIRRAKEQDMAVNLDFHYSDVWADPEHQDVPKAWCNITSIDVLCDSVYNYTYAVLASLHSQNLLPEMVQIGNETNCGLMHTEKPVGFPNLSVCNGDWVNVGKVLNAGIKAVRDMDKKAGKSTVIALHVADPKNMEWWFDDIMDKANVSDFDVVGFSYYPIWHTTVTFNELPALVTRLKNKFQKDIMILETAYPYTTAGNDTYNNLFGNQTPLADYPFTPKGQKDFMIDLTQKMMDAGAKGVMYWEPAWISSQMKDMWGTGSSWENCTFFDFSGNVTETIDFMQFNYEE